MATISKIKISNSNYDLKGSLLYGVCETSSGAASKAVTVDGNFSLYNGTMVMVKFIYSNSVTAPTLNVNGSGARPIVYYDNGLITWNTDSIKILIYDGTNWVIVNKDNYVELSSFEEALANWDEVVSQIVCNLYGIDSMDDYTGASIKEVMSTHTHSVTHKPAGSVSSTFTGKEVTTSSISGTVSAAPANHTHSVTISGTTSTPAFSGEAVNSGTPSDAQDIYQITGVGSVATQTYSIDSEVPQRMIITFNGGSVPTRAKVTIPTAAHTHSVTAKGSVSAPTFSGTATSEKNSGTNVTAASGTHTHTVTADGTVSSSFAGTSATITTTTPNN